MYELVYIYEFEGDVSEKVRFIKDEDYIGFWREGQYSFLFYRAPKRGLLERLSLPVRSELTIRHEDWESGGPLAPLQVGRIGIHQPWNGPVGAPFDILVDPNMAFGSGFHASTRGCLTLLDRNRSLNGLEERLHLVMGKAEDFLSLRTDLIIANMHFAVIDPLTRIEEFYTRDYYLVSGLMRTEGASIIERLSLRLELLDSYSENFWFTYLFKKREGRV